MNYIKIGIGLMLLTGLFLAFYFSVPKYYVHFTAGIIFILLELNNYINFLRRIKGGYFFKVRSNAWIEAVFLTAGLTFLFSDQPMNHWNIIAISALILSGILRVKRNSSEYFRITEEEILNLNKDSNIKAEIITGIRITENELAVDTKKYRNDLVIKSKDLQKPKWGELIKNFSELEKEWALRSNR